MVEPYEHPLNVNTHLSKKQILINNFLGGMAWGFGSVVGATAVIATVTYILKRLGVFDTIGAFFGQFGPL